ncbi:MAG: M14 family zinc carboxypeptidase [Bacteroidales bacterium]
MLKNRSLVLIFLVLFVHLNAQVEISYFLPETDYNSNIPSPEEFLGYQIGDWHLNHTLLAQYMNIIAEKSDRAMIYEYARSYEHRPLYHLVITSEENQRNLEEIRKNHLALTNPEASGIIDVKNMPAVIRLGYGVHGNEASAHNAAPLVAYYLAAGQSDRVLDILDNLVIIIDPSLNPDGQDRFASWVNRYKSKTLNPDPNSMEFNDVWPGSRTNHYWFDLNRDWLPVQHPESYGRIRAYHNWMPNINTDHHEMGSNATFFFQPGVPERLNPRTPHKTDELTLEVAKYHAAAFDEIGQLYYTQQGFDDFYYGKGSTYPDIHGGIGILFEQASTRGHRRETIHGVTDFAETIKNQVVVSLSSIEAGLSMRETLLNHLRWFYSTAVEEASGEPFQAWIFGDEYDNGKNYHLLDILNTHQIQVYEINDNISVGGQTYYPGSAWVVPLRQRQYRLVMTLFEKVLEFGDSLFYDVSTWTKPLAFNMPYGRITSESQLRSLQGEMLDTPRRPHGNLAGNITNNAYLFQWDDYYAPRALYYLQKEGLRTKVATEPFSISTGSGKLVEFNYGTIMVHVNSQDCTPRETFELVGNAAKHAGITIHSVETSFSSEGIHLGSGSFADISRPDILMLTGPGTSSREAGEVWHLLDQRYNIPVTKVETDRINSMDLSRYNTIIMVSGSYNSINDTGKASLNRWLRSGGNIVALGSANQWLAKNEFASIEFVPPPEQEEPGFLPYIKRSEYRGARRISGTIFETSLDITHPVGYGYRNELLPYYVTGHLAAKPDSSPFANPLLFTGNALLSGYVWEPWTNHMDSTAGILINSRGRGNIVSFIHNPNFRAFWFGTQFVITLSHYGRLILSGRLFLQ